jgi:hypothetical protein
MDIEPVGLGEGMWHAGFHLRSEAGKNGKRGSNKRGNGDG